MMKSLRYFYFLSLLILLLTASCSKPGLGIFKSSSARETYLTTLDNSGLSDSKIGQSWISKANESLNTASELILPTAISGSFKSKTVDANAWKIYLEKGTTVTIEISWTAADSSMLIVDLLDASSNEELESHAITKDSLQLEADKTGPYLLRIQPELLGEGNFQILISSVQTYAVFPVQGKNTSSIQSFWGAARDGGARSHEGVDIFASRGTPVLAPVKGVVTSVRDRGLGGKQVWLRDSERNWSLYFAHLDSQLVSNLQRVMPGDTLGLVGNTGNARTTAPHLHFGIYETGAFDPFPVINTDHKNAEPFPLKETPTLLLISVDQANVRSGPRTDADLLFQLTKSTPVLITASTADWYQIKTLEGKSGFIYQQLLSEPMQERITEASGVVYPSFKNLSNGLLVDFADFTKVAELESFEVITDKDENVYFKAKD